MKKYFIYYKGIVTVEAETPEEALQRFKEENFSDQKTMIERVQEVEDGERNN